MSTTNPPKPLFREDGKRLSGREDTDLREIKMQVGIFKKAQGSAMVEWGKNKVVAGVYGPKEVFPKFLADPYKGIIAARYIMAPFSGAEEHGRAGPNRRSLEISKVVRHVFENNVLLQEFPKTGIDIQMEVIQSDGGTRVTAIAAASLALIDAGIPVYDIVTPISVGKVGGKMVVDLDKDEDNFGEGDLPMAFSLRTGELLLWQMDGLISRDELEDGLNKGFEAAQKVRVVQEAALKEKYGDFNGSDTGQN